MSTVRRISTIFLFLISLGLSAQAPEDFALAKSIMQEREKPDYSYHYEGETEVLEFMKLLFSGYKAFISSQDMQACVFHPSCSVYAMQAVREKGLIGGSVDAFDRMTRCHPLNLDQYEVHKESGLAHDPLSPEEK